MPASLLTQNNAVFFSLQKWTRLGMNQSVGLRNIISRMGPYSNDSVICQPDKWISVRGVPVGKCSP